MISGPVKRRIAYTLVYEALAIVCTTGFLMLLGNNAEHSLPFAMVSSLVAIVWNYIWNTLFEKMEVRFGWKGRSVGVRVLHAIGFEGGLAVSLIPLMAWWLNISLLEALITDIGILIFFLAYTYLFNLAFDKLFGLPQSAQ